MTPLFALTIFLSATLLFMVQPLAAKMLLPVLGGSPSVWSTCMVFFQAVLLLGYLYAHLLSTRVAIRSQRATHIALLAAACVAALLPTALSDPGGAAPRWWLLQRLLLSVGLPFFVLSATAPLLQHWYSRTDDPRAGDPYFLYAASNAGSLLGLLGYLVLEPFVSRTAQTTVWSAAFIAVAALIIWCARGSLRRQDARTRNAAPPNRNSARRTRNNEPKNQNLEPRTRNLEPPSVHVRLLWVALAMVPSALLLGVTQHLATDVVSAPLLWVIPMALYLMTFIAAFGTRGFGSAHAWGRVAPLMALLVLLLSLAEVRYPILPIALVHLAGFVVLAMMCHTRLAESRPAPARLTDFFLCVSLGGALGGAVVALVAPAVFSSILEYPLAIAAAILLRPQTAHADRRAGSPVVRWAWRAGAALLVVAGYWAVSAFNAHANSGQLSSAAIMGWLQTRTGHPEVAQRLLRASLAIPAILLLLVPRTGLLFAGVAAGLLVGGGVVRTGGDVLFRERSFFGVSEVSSIQNGSWHVLTHGTTTHGVQAVRGKISALPTAYYHPTGPIGDVVFTLSPERRFRDVAVVGLGAGALAAYAGEGVRMDFFEIDETVIRIAQNPRFFTYLRDANNRRGTVVKTTAVDGRLGLRGMPAASYDLIVIDAFSSDAIPTHLMTREAIALFVSRLKPRGVMAFHVSNRFFNLGPVLARIAGDQGLVSYVRNDHNVAPERATQAVRPSVWVVLGRTAGDLGQLAQSAPRWVTLSGAGAPLWTDDYTNVFGALER